MTNSENGVFLEEWERPGFAKFLSISQARETECGLMPGWREKICDEIAKEESNDKI